MNANRVNRILAFADHRHETVVGSAKWRGGGGRGGGRDCGLQERRTGVGQLARCVRRRVRHDDGMTKNLGAAQIRRQNFGVRRRYGATAGSAAFLRILRPGRVLTKKEKNLYIYICFSFSFQFLVFCDFFFFLFFL